MIFAARGLLVSLAFFATVYCPLSLLVVAAWPGIKRASRIHRFASAIVGSANFLLGLRIFSFAVSSVTAVFFAFPSFWFMEKTALDEDAGTFLLGACGLLILGAGVSRAFRAQVKTSRAVAQWSLHARAETGNTPANCGSEGAPPVLSAAAGAPALILVGIRKPRVMISDMAASVLTERELRVAVQHELGHMRSRDNLKKVIISSTPFPGMNGIESSWREASELEADAAAVSNREDALDLAAALIKLLKSSEKWIEPMLASGLVSGSSSVSLRVERLLEWRMPARHIQRSWAWAFLLFAIAIASFSNYGATLALTHRLTEILVP